MVDVAGIQQIQKRLERVRRDLRTQAAGEIARSFTRLTRAAYDSGRQVDGSARPLGVRGNKLSLVRTGATRAGLRFAASKGAVTVKLAGASPYLLKYGILPMNGLPPNWVAAASTIVKQVAKRLGGTP